MKNVNAVFVLLVAVLVLSCAGCKSTKDNQQKPDAAKDLPAELAISFREDAARLAVRELNSSTQAGERSAEIPKERVAYFYGLLSQIYWMSVKSDSIPDLSGIHTKKDPNLNQVAVMLEKDSPYIENWSKGITLTSNLYLNQLISKHKLSIKNYRESSVGPTLLLESLDYINTGELSFLIKSYESIRSAEPVAPMGDGNDISWGSDSKNAKAIKFSIGAGDCPSGCIQRKFWVFYVMPDSSINYMGTRGSIPKEMEPK